MKRLTILLILLLTLLGLSEGSSAWVKAYYSGFDGGNIEMVDWSTIRVYADQAQINVWANGVGNNLPWNGGGMSYDLDGSGDINYPQDVVTQIAVIGVGSHTITIKYWQYNANFEWLTVATKTYHFTLVYPTPIAPTISIGAASYHPVVSWTGINYYAVQQNTTNGYEIYRRDYQGNTLWHDWSKKASVSGTVTSWTDGSVGGAPMGLDKVEYQVRAVDLAGQIGPFSNVGTTRVFFQYKIFAGGVPGQYSFKEGYPNPFNPATHMQYDLPAAGSVSLLILDIQGREVKSLQAGFAEAGSYGITWNAADQATGVYFARLVVTDQSGKAVYTKTNKLLLTK